MVDAEVSDRGPAPNAESSQLPRAWLIELQAVKQKAQAGRSVVCVCVFCVLCFSFLFLFYYGFCCFLLPVFPRL